MFVSGEFMRKEKINGVTVPYNKATDELEIMLSSGDMSDFVVACEALSYKTDEKAFNLLKGYINNKDKYKRLCILKTIFRHLDSIQLKAFLEEAILSDDINFAENGLKNAYDYNIKISDEIILTAVNKHYQSLHCTFLYVLRNLNENEENFLRLVELFKKSEISGQKEVLSDILCEKYLPEKADVLFSIFSNDVFPKIRFTAVRIGKEYNFDITMFYNDLDGHVRKEATEKIV